MVSDKFYVDKRRNNNLMLRISNNRRKVELNMGIQMDEETLSDASSSRWSRNNLSNTEVSLCGWS